MPPAAKATRTALNSVLTVCWPDLLAERWPRSRACELEAACIHVRRWLCADKHENWSAKKRAEDPKLLKLKEDKHKQEIKLQRAFLAGSPTVICVTDPLILVFSCLSASVCWHLLLCWFRMFCRGGYSPEQTAKHRTRLCRCVLLLS